jgi:prepilin-type N-terminal cleavage/methylation domain-containing protein
LRIITRDYRKDKGMTLIEIMIALGVFSTVMLIVVNVIRFVGLFTADTLNQVRMAELAQGEIEKIKAGNPPINGNLDYPNSDTPEQSYPVQYNTYPVDARNLAGQILKVTVGSPPEIIFLLPGYLRAKGLLSTWFLEEARGSSI